MLLTLAAMELATAMRGPALLTKGTRTAIETAMTIVTEIEGIGIGIGIGRSTAAGNDHGTVAVANEAIVIENGATEVKIETGVTTGTVIGTGLAVDHGKRSGDAPDRDPANEIVIVITAKETARAVAAVAAVAAIDTSRPSVIGIAAHQWN